MARTRRGKIAKLPAEIRAEVNRRMLDGQPGRQILDWLNAHDRVRPILAAQFAGADINDQNLTEWRQGGYMDWVEDREKLDALKELSLFAGGAVKSGGGIADGAAAIAAGKLITAIECAAPEDLVKLSAAIAALRGGDVDNRKLQLKAREVKTKEAQLALDEKRFQLRTVEKLLEALDSDKAAAIARAPDLDRGAKVDKLGQLMFGDDWQ